MERTATEHNTGFTEEGEYGPPALYLTRDSAQQYLTGRAKIETTDATSYRTTLFTFIPALILIVTGLLFGAVLGSAAIPILGGGIFFLIIAAITTVTIGRRESRQREAIQALTEDAGVKGPFRLHLFDGTSLLPREARREITLDAMGHMTPEVRDRFLDLIADGNQEAVQEALNMLVEEASSGWVANNRRLRKEREAEKKNLARRALERPDQ